MASVLVYVPSTDGAADEIALQALALGAQVAAGGPVHAIVFGDAAAASLGAYGATAVHVAEHPGLAVMAPDARAKAIGELADRLGVDAIVGPGTDAGNTVLARVAAREDVPFAANCTAVMPGSSPLQVTRVRWGGSLSENAVIRAPRAILSSAPHAVAVVETGGSAGVSTFTPSLSDADFAVRVVGRTAPAASGISLAEARVVVSGGRGVGSEAGFGPIEELAGLLGAAVGCSRAVTIAGWRSHTAQVGQTGTKIAPDVYIAAGISGATQHMAGCKASKKIIAINKDAEAPIMSGADYAVIGDLHQVIPAISAEIRKVRGA